MNKLSPKVLHDLDSVINFFETSDSNDKTVSHEFLAFVHDNDLFYLFMFSPYYRLLTLCLFKQR